MSNEVWSDVHRLSKYIIGKFQENSKDLTNLKLQKVLYYVQGYALAKLGRRAFDEAIYNWAYGPVVLDSYYEFRFFESEPITLENCEVRIYDSKLKGIVDQVLDKTYDLHPFTLVKMSQNESPWLETEKNDLIPVSSIKHYFENNDPLNLDDDPFYSEENMKHLRESIEQSKRGETRHLDIKERFADYEGDYISEEIDWGEPVGEEDPFYSEENMKALVEAKKQLDQGKGIHFDIEKLCEEFEKEEWSKPYTDIDEMFKGLGLYD